MFAILAVGSAAAVVSFKHPIHSALSFLITLLSIADLYGLLDSKFLFVVQILVYAGAILVLSIFVIMYLNIRIKDLPRELKTKRQLALLLVAQLPLLVLVGNFLIQDVTLARSTFNINETARFIFSEAIMPFELLSVLLTVAVISTVLIVKTDGSECSGE